MMPGSSFVVDGMKVVFQEKDIPMLEDALKSLKLQIRLSKSDAVQKGDE